MVHFYRTLGLQYILRHRPAFAALCVCLSASSAAVTDAKADASIVVDAGSSQSDCGSNCDDLKTLQNIFQDANIPAEPTNGAWLTAGNQMIADLGMKRTRLLEADVYCDALLDDEGRIYFGYTDNGGFHEGDCFPLLWDLQWAFGNHLSPHVAVAYFMPPSFAGYNVNTVTGQAPYFYGGAENWSMAELDVFKTYAYDLVNYIVQKSITAQVPSVVFEVGNEIDGVDPAPVGFPTPTPACAPPPVMPTLSLLPLGSYGRGLWWIDPSSYQIEQWCPAQADSYPYTNTNLAYPYAGDVRRLDHGITPLYQIFAQAVARVRIENPNFAITIAGPTMASLSFQWNPPNGRQTLEEDFLDQVANPNKVGSNCSINPTCGQFTSELDHFSFHYYGSAVTLPTPITLETITNTVKSKLQALGKSNVPLFLSEWGPTTLENTDVNYSHKGAAWAAAFLPEAVKAGIQMGSYLILEDGLTTGSPPYDRGQASLLGEYVGSDGTTHYYPKPPANVFKMYAKMTGTRRQATVSPAGGSSSNLGAFVTSDTNSAHVLVYNYSPQLVFNNPSNTDSPENVSVQLNNLPFNGSVTVTRYLVDSVTSNFEAFVANPTDPTKNPVLQSVETYTATVTGGQLTLPPPDTSGNPTTTTLGLGVTYWRVTQ